MNCATVDCSTRSSCPGRYNTLVHRARTGRLSLHVSLATTPRDAVVTFVMYHAARCRMAKHTQVSTVADEPTRLVELYTVPDAQSDKLICVVGRASTVASIVNFSRPTMVASLSHCASTSARVKTRIVVTCRGTGYEVAPIYSA